MDRQDIWYKLFSRGSAGCRDCEWLQDLVKSETKFKGVIRSLLAYLLIKSQQRTESYSIHPVVHNWCAETIGNGKGNLIVTALILISTAAPDYSEVDYWLLQQRLIPYADRYIGQIDNFDLLHRLGSVEASGTLHNLGLLYTGQDKYAEAEKIYRRALDGYEIARGPDHTSTLDTVNDLRLLKATRGKYMKAEEIHLRALDKTRYISTSTIITLPLRLT